MEVYIKNRKYGYKNKIVKRHLKPRKE